ncbi:MAG: DNA polymerase IV, partial [Oscillospiraceae bacterium]|nr:DNA polymerase IV [Oscillospiraceae bacterium]
MNSFYASVECLHQPALRDKPVAVGGDAEARHGIILAKNQLAKKFGVKTGEALWQARQKCPDLVIVHPHYDQYMRFSRLSREIYGEYTDRVEPFGLDECWLDVTGTESQRKGGEALAQELRRRIMAELGVTVSVGVSDNKIFAKLGSDYKKPDAVTVFSRREMGEKVWPLPVTDLLYVGPATGRKLRNYGVETIG